MQPFFLPATILLFFIKFPFSCVQLIHCLYKWNLNICLYNYLCRECLPSLLPVSNPKRGKLAKTKCISQNCDEICLKTPKSGRNARVFAKYTQKLTKALNSNWKTRFCFVFICAKFSLFHVQKHDVFSKIGIRMWKHLIQLERSVLSKIWAKNA